jgi:signal transduction histidine kinase
VDTPIANHDLIEARSAPVRIFSAALLPRFFAAFLPLALLTAVAVLALYLNDRVSEHRLHVKEGSHLVDLHVNIIAGELKAAESELLYLANQDVLRKFLSGGSADARDALQRNYVLFCDHRRVYDQIRFLDESGFEEIRINFNAGKPAAVKTGRQKKGNRYYFTRTRLLKAGQVFVSPLDLNIEHGEIEIPHKPTIRLATPVFDNDRFRGILILNYLGAGLLDKLARVSRTFPGSVYLLNRDGFFLRGPTPEDEWGFMLGHQRTFKARYPDAWQQRDMTRQVETPEGLFTFRTFWPDLALSANPPEAAADPSDPDAGDPSLQVVSFIPPEVLNSRPTQLLHTLLRLYAVVLAIILVLSWYLAYAGALRRRHELQLAQSEGRLRSLSTQLLTAHEEERRSLARDLHDELGQMVTSMTLDLQRAGANNDPPKKDELIGRALHGAEAMLDRIHEIASRVRPALLDDLGLKDAVQNLLCEYERRTGIVPRADLRFDRPDVPALVSDNVYRILQEGLTNVAKHAGAAEVFISLQTAAHKLALTIRDTGAGFAPQQLDGKRLGILGMRERAKLLNGTFTIRAAPAQGTEIQVTVPLLSSEKVA